MGPCHFLKILWLVLTAEQFLKKDKSETIAKTKEKIEEILLTDKTINELKGKSGKEDTTDVKETGKDLNKLRKELKEAKKKLAKIEQQVGPQGSSDPDDDDILETTKTRVKDLEKQIRTNGFWASGLDWRLRYGEPLEDILKHNRYIEALTAQQIQSHLITAKYDGAVGAVRVKSRRVRY